MFSHLSTMSNIYHLGLHVFFLHVYTSEYYIILILVFLAIFMCIVFFLLDAFLVKYSCNNAFATKFDKMFQVILLKDIFLSNFHRDYIWHSINSVYHYKLSLSTRSSTMFQIALMLYDTKFIVSNGLFAAQNHTLFHTD